MCVARRSSSAGVPAGQCTDQSSELLGPVLRSCCDFSHARSTSARLGRAKYARCSSGIGIVAIERVHKCVASVGGRLSVNIGIGWTFAPIALLGHSLGLQAEQPVHQVLDKPASPLANRLQRTTQTLRHFRIRGPLRTDWRLGYARLLILSSASMSHGPTRPLPVLCSVHPDGINDLSVNRLLRPRGRPRTH